MASIPTDDDADMQSMSQHKKAIMGSIVKFTIPPRADHEGGWKHRDMMTSLFHYQVYPKTRRPIVINLANIIKASWGWIHGSFSVISY